MKSNRTSPSGKGTRASAIAALAAALSLPGGGCSGGYSQHFYQAVESEGRLTLRWHHEWEELRVVIRRPNMREFEEVRLELTGVAIGEEARVGQGKATARYDHGGRHRPCLGYHLIQGTVKLIARTDKDVRAQFDLTLTCPGNSGNRLSQVNDFEIKTHLPER